MTRVRVALTLGVDKAALPSLENAVKVFEDYCTVTQSVRAGVAVDVEIRDNTGAIVHTSIDEAR